MKFDPYRFWGPEDHLLASVAQHLRTYYPDTVWWHTPNEGRRSVLTKVKRMGIRSGVSDVIIVSKSPQFKGLVIELKIKPNKPTPNQLAFLTDMKDCGWETAVTYTFDETENLIDAFMERSGSKPKHPLRKKKV